MYVIGLTGGIGSGKSTISRMLRGLGACIIDADAVAREIVEPGQPAWEEVVAHFGREVLHPEGTLNRQALGAVIFEDDRARELLNAITHPRVQMRTEELLDKYRKERRAVAVIDAPLLIEAGFTGMVDEVWVAAVDEPTQIRRLCRRDGITREEAQKKIATQMPLAEKLRFAHRVINTGGAMADTEEQVLRAWKEITASCHESGGLA